jgi:hypothetical protein
VPPKPNFYLTQIDPNAIAVLKPQAAESTHPFRIAPGVVVYATERPQSVAFRTSGVSHKETIFALMAKHLPEWLGKAGTWHDDCSRSL